MAWGRHQRVDYLHEPGEVVGLDALRSPPGARELGRVLEPGEAKVVAIAS
jgi:hypothetical protein